MQDIRIYIAEQHGETSFGTTTVLSTLNYGSFVAPLREAIGRLQQVNTWEVLARGSLDPLTDGDIVSFLIPRVGNLLVTVNEHTYSIPVGTVFIYQTQKA